jgi:hypothetical protein
VKAATGSELLAGGQVTETGVLPSEACVPPQAVLQPLAESGPVEINEELISCEYAVFFAA